MAEHMAKNIPTLTEHFKQALNMTRSQMQAGPSALTSATQMGVTSGLSGGGFGGPSPPPPPLLNVAAATGVRPDMAVYGSGGGHGSGTVSNENTGNGLMGYFQSYGKWIFLVVVILAGISFYFWWKKQQRLKNGKSNFESDLVEDMQVALRRPLNRQHPNGADSEGGSRNFINAPFNPSRFGPVPPQSSQTQQVLLHPQLPPTSISPPENLRGNEQQGLVRGAEFSNPNISSHMIPMSTRSKPQESVQNIPPQDLRGAVPSARPPSQVSSTVPNPQQQQQISYPPNPQQLSPPPNPQQLSYPPNPQLDQQQQQQQLPLSPPPPQLDQQPQVVVSSPPPLPLAVPISEPVSTHDPNFTSV